LKQYLYIYLGLIFYFSPAASAQNAYWRHRLSVSFLSDNNVFHTELMPRKAAIGRLQVFTEHGAAKTNMSYRFIYEGSLDHMVISESGSRHVHQLRGQIFWRFNPRFGAGINGLIRSRSVFEADYRYAIRAINPLFSIHLSPGWNLSISGGFNNFDYGNQCFDYNEQHLQADIRRYVSPAFSLRLSGKTGRFDYSLTGQTDGTADTAFVSESRSDYFWQMMLFMEYYGRILVQAEAGLFRLLRGGGHEYTMPVFKILAAGSLVPGLTGRVYWSSQLRRFNDSLIPDSGFMPESEFEKLHFLIFDLSCDISRSQDIWIRWGIYQNESDDRNFLFRKTVLSVGTTRRFH
jgi:hypothetical protein